MLAWASQRLVLKSGTRAGRPLAPHPCTANHTRTSSSALFAADTSHPPRGPHPGGAPLPLPSSSRPEASPSRPANPMNSGASARAPVRPTLVRAAHSLPASTSLSEVKTMDGVLSLRAAAPVLFVASPAARQRLAALPRLDIDCLAAVAAQDSLAGSLHPAALGSAGSSDGPRAAFSSPSPSPSTGTTPSATYSPLSSALGLPSSALLPSSPPQPFSHALHGHASAATLAGKHAADPADDADDASQEPPDDGEPGWYRAAWQHDGAHVGVAQHRGPWRARFEAALRLDQ